MSATLLGDLTWPQARDVAAAGAVLAVPVGATEQHGPHLPLSTDSDIALALCVRLSTQHRGVVVAPLVAYGSSGEHDGFAGTLSIGGAALEHLLVELGRSAANTFRRLLFVCGHGGNVSALARAVALLRGEGRDARWWAPSGYVDAHAGHAETSLQLALDETRVHTAAAERGDTRPLSNLMPLLRAGGVRSVSANGVLGDPHGASVDDGRALLSRLVDDLVSFVDPAFPAALVPVVGP